MLQARYHGVSGFLEAAESLDAVIMLHHSQAIVVLACKHEIVLTFEPFADVPKVLAS